MRAVISGAGAAGLLHALALRAADVAIEAVYDPDAQRARDLADLCGARVADGMAELASSDAALACVCGPPSVHVDQALALADAGRVVFVEKPVATTEQDLDRLARAPGTVPILQWRAGRALRALRRAIRHGELGDAPSVSCDLAWGRDDAYFAARAGWGCGALLSIGVHALDALVWALGRAIVTATSATNARLGLPVEAGETVASALLGFAGGATASLRLSLDGGGDATRIVACGRGATAFIAGGEADPTASRIAWSALDPAKQARLAALEADTPGALGSPLLVPYLGAAVAALRDGEAPGDSERIPTIASTRSAHAVAIRACPLPASSDLSGGAARAS